MKWGYIIVEKMLIPIKKSIKIVFRYLNLEEVKEIIKLKKGFSRLVFSVNDKYVIKICINPDKENQMRNEKKFYANNKSTYTPDLIIFDDSKKILPYIYSVEQKINGKNLFEIWSKVNQTSKERFLDELVKILKLIHHPTIINDEKRLETVSKFNLLLDKCISKNIFSSDEIKYLKQLEYYMKKYFSDAKFGYIHGDLHFNNIFWTKDGIKLIDFENYEIAPLDKEFDSISRMVRDPNSFLLDKKLWQNPTDYKIIMDYLKEIYPEVCNQTNFENRLLIYDCLNSMNWIYYYPSYERYHKILFHDSKKLIIKK